MGIAEIQLLILGIAELNKFAMTVAQANAEGRALTAAEIQTFKDGLTAAFADADAAYARAVAEGR
jgi:hypothetical protein